VLSPIAFADVQNIAGCMRWCRGRRILKAGPEKFKIVGVEFTPLGCNISPVL
jgi:hypothetical protein